MRISFTNDHCNILLQSSVNPLAGGKAVRATHGENKFCRHHRFLHLMMVWKLKSAKILIALLCVANWLESELATRGL